MNDEIINNPTGDNSAMSERYPSVEDQPADGPSTTEQDQPLRDEAEPETIFHDADTGEITDEEPRPLTHEQAVDGLPVPSVARNAGEFMNQIEDGQFSADMHQELMELAAMMNDQSSMFPGKKIKGKLTVVVDMEKEDQMFKVGAKFTVKKPEMPRPKSVFWTDQRNQFSRFPPNQHQMFGVRPAVRTGGGKVGGVRTVS